MLNVFGNEVRFLNTTITTANHTRFSLKNKNFVKFILRFIGLPHFGARLRAFYLNSLLDQLIPESKILDAGCGIGLNSFLAARKGHIVTGIDNDSEKIVLAKKMLSRSNYPNVSFLKNDVTKLQFTNKSFNCVMCIEVLEHIEDDRKAIQEISRILNDDGLFIVSVPGIGVISRLNQHHKHHVREGYSLPELKKKLGEADLRIKKVVKIEHTYLGLAVRFLNDEIHQRSLLITTLLFPLFLPLAIFDGYLPELIAPNNWIIVAKKTTGALSGSKSSR